MTSPNPGPSLAERLDRAIDEILVGVPPGLAAAGAGVAGAERPLVATAAAVHDALAASAVAPRFEARLGALLAGTVAPPGILRHPGRLIVTGAVGSAVGVGVTAYAVWRSTRRGLAHQRLLHR